MLEQQTTVADLPYAEAETIRPSRRLRQLQVTSLGLLVMSNLINMIDRSTLSIANPLIRHDLGISIGQMGLLLSSFLWAYAFCQLPVGFFVDRIGPRLLLGTAQIVWSAAQLFCGFAGGFAEFCALRMLLGAGNRRNLRSARAWCGIVSALGNVAYRPACSCSVPRSARRFPHRSSRCS